MMQRDERDGTQTTRADEGDEDAVTRRPYESPRVRSGAAFENVTLASGDCSQGPFCEIPC